MIEWLSDDLHDAYLSLYENWRTNLSLYGITFPEGEGKVMALLCLYSHLGEPISQPEMIDWIVRHGGTYNRQARHLGGADGWYIVTGNSRARLIPFDEKLERNELMLVSITEANPVWLATKEKEKEVEEMNAIEEYEFNRLNQGEWDKILDKFSDRGCGICGRQFPNLEKGRLNYDKPATINNVIPLCSDCKTWSLQTKFCFSLEKPSLIVRPLRDSKI
tara:strand:- start:593 stop:1249 length:657 start_codon:yes stop_codon:yes gene_type:complete